MRKIIGAVFVSLDGVMQAPGGPIEDSTGGFTLGGWLPHFVDGAGGNRIDALFGGDFDLLLGRRTYEIFAAYWPFAEGEEKALGEKFNRAAKYVVAHGDAPLEWQNSHRVADLDALADVKRGVGLSPEQARLVARYIEAFEKYDIAALTALLHEEATLAMPPYDFWLQGHDSIARWLIGFGIGCKGSRLVPVEACGGTPAFAQYRDGGTTPWALIMLELDADRITNMTSYLDVETLFPRFGSPMQLAPH